MAIKFECSYDVDKNMYISAESPPYMRGRRIPTVVVGVASPSFPCARKFGVMHSGTKGGATITDGRIYTPRELGVFKKRLDRPIVNP